MSEWLSIRALTNKEKWTDPQRTMMRRATKLHGARSGFATLGLIALVCVGWMVRNEVVRQQDATRIEGLVGRLVSADPNQLPGIIKELDANQLLAKKYLSPLVSSNPTTLDEKRSQLHARLAMVSSDPSLRESLVDELLSNKVVYVGPIRQQLRPWSKELTEKFRDILRDEQGDAQRRFRASLALADYVPESETAWWTEQDLKFVAEQLVVANAEFQPLLRENLRPIRGLLLGDLEKIFADSNGTDGQRLSAANAFSDYAAGDIAKLSQLLTVATPEQYAVLYPLVAASPTPATLEDLSKIAATSPEAELGSVERVSFGQRRANAAVTLLRLGESEKVLSVFEMTDDPEALTQFIFRCRPRGVGIDALLDLFKIVSTERQGANVAGTFQGPSATESPVFADGPRSVPATIAIEKYAILLALGEFALTEIPEPRREPLLKQLSDAYRNDPSSGVHGAAGWLLRQWGQTEVVREVDQTPVPYSIDREWFTLAITVTPNSPPKPVEKPGQEKEASESEPDKPAPDKPEPPVEPLPPKTFYFTFIMFPAGKSEIGSVDDEPDREKDERRHTVSRTQPFALCDREVTFDELIAFAPKYTRYMEQFDARSEDAGFAADWYDSVSFSRWLGQQSELDEADQSYADPEFQKEKYPREPDPRANWAPRDWPLVLGRRGFRLPTESEWEIASRARARTSYGYGSDHSLLNRFGWFSENSGKHVHPPRELRPSVRGVFDLHGNLLEWTHDWYSAYDAESLTDSLGAKGGSSRVLRGGGWLNDAAFCRSARRITIDPTNRTYYNGFRLALSPSSESSRTSSKVAEPVGVGTQGAPAEQRPEMP